LCRTANIVGKAFFVWMNFGNLKRIGSFIELQIAQQRGVNLYEHARFSRSRQRGLSSDGPDFCCGLLAVAVCHWWAALPRLSMEYRHQEGHQQSQDQKARCPMCAPFLIGQPPIDDIKSIKGKDLEVTKRGDKMVVSFKYATRNSSGWPGLRWCTRFQAQTN
jgi:hypothetical protein